MDSWARRLQLALEDFLVELGEELRAAIRAEQRARAGETPRRTPRPRPARVRRVIDREGRAVASAWATLIRLSGDASSFAWPMSLEHARTMVRKARYATHPDRKAGKSSRDFLRVQRAADVLSAHFQVTL